MEDNCHFFQSVLFMLIAEKWMSEKEYRTIFRVQKKYRKEAFKSQSLSSLAAYWSQTEGKNVEHIPDFLLDCCFSAKRKISKILCKILNIMSQIFLRGAGGKTAKRKCFSIGVMILTSFPKHFGIHSSNVTSIFNN